MKRKQVVPPPSGTPQPCAAPCGWAGRRIRRSSSRDAPVSIASKDRPDRQAFKKRLKFGSPPSASPLICTPSHYVPDEFDARAPCTAGTCSNSPAVPQEQGSALPSAPVCPPPQGQSSVLPSAPLCSPPSTTRASVPPAPLAPQPILSPPISACGCRPPTTPRRMFLTAGPLSPPPTCPPPLSASCPCLPTAPFCPPPPSARRSVPASPLALPAPSGDENLGAHAPPVDDRCQATHFI